MNPVTHFEIPAKDVSRLAEFYSQAFGWQIKDVFGMGYHFVTTTGVDEKGMPTTPGAVNGGMVGPEAGISSPLLVVSVPDLEKALKAVEAAGGKIAMPAAKVGEMGLYARFNDPQGNLMGLWQDLA